VKTLTVATFMSAILAAAALAGCSSGSQSTFRPSTESAAISPDSSAQLDPFEKLKVYVPATSPYTDTGIAVTANQHIRIRALGYASHGGCGPSCGHKSLRGPNGLSFDSPRCSQAQQRSTFIAPGLACFALIAVIGSPSTGTPFFVGKLLEYEVPASVSGELYLGYNDSDFSNNSGGFHARIRSASL